MDRICYKGYFVVLYLFLVFTLPAISNNYRFTLLSSVKPSRVRCPYP
ncbi:hypothetical protein DSUL_50218 [Desulfovibrionales bacterium]